MVSVQLGRPARGRVDVAARCPFGLPLAIRTSSQLEDGTPFPTLYYLTCPVAVRDVGTMESTGQMAVLNRRLSEDPVLAQAYREAHERYLRLRGDVAGQGGVTAGGMPDRVKCLHALYAHEVADANPVGAIVRDRIEPLDCPGECVTLRDGQLARVQGHPGFRGRR